MNNPLRDIGLNEREEGVYRTLVKSGETTVSELARKLGIKRPTLYLAIDQLIMLGLISDKKQNKKRVLSPIHPRRILQIARLKTSSIENQLPELIAQYELPKNKPKIDIYQGERGVKNLYEELNESLSNRQEALFISDFTAIRERVPSALISFKRIVRGMRNPKIRELAVKNEGGIWWEKDLRPIRGKNHKIKFLPTDREFGSTDICILGDVVFMFSIEKNDIFVVRIQSGQISKTYKSLFEIAWAQNAPRS